MRDPKEIIKARLISRKQSISEEVVRIEQLYFDGKISSKLYNHKIDILTKELGELLTDANKIKFNFDTFKFED